MRTIHFEDGLTVKGVELGVRVLGPDNRHDDQPKLLVLDLSGGDLMEDVELRLDWVGVGMLEEAVQKWKALDVDAERRR